MTAGVQRTLASLGRSDGIVIVDCHYRQPQMAASYVIVEDDEVMVIEANTSRAVSHILDAITALGLGPENVRFIAITHAHLDHAGGASTLLRHCPRATVLTHPRAARFLVDPRSLVLGVRYAFGDAEYDRLFGSVGRIDPDRIRGVDDGETIDFGTRRLSFFYVSGHAEHHVCIHDHGSQSVFTGDTFGAAYPFLQSAVSPWLLPLTPPPELDTGAALRAIDRILATGAKRALLTHFGVWEDLAEGARQLRAGIARTDELIDRAAERFDDPSSMQTWCFEQLWEDAMRELDERGLNLSPTHMAELKSELQLNSQGITAVARRQ